MRRLTRDRETLALVRHRQSATVSSLRGAQRSPRHCEARSVVAIRVFMLQQNLSY
jgi:hypothetical protein